MLHTAGAAGTHLYKLLSFTIDETNLLTEASTGVRQ